MKKTNKKAPKFLIDVCAYLSDVVQANREAQGSADYRLTDNEFDIWVSIVETVMSVISSKNFNIIRQGRSKKDCSYRFDFYRILDTGEFSDTVQIRFRLSNLSTDLNESDASSKRMFRKFTVNGFVCPPNVLELMNIVGELCESLTLGDYSSVLELNKPHRKRKGTKENPLAPLKLFTE